MKSFTVITTFANHAVTDLRSFLVHMLLQVMWWSQCAHVYVYSLVY